MSNKCPQNIHSFSRFRQKATRHLDGALEYVLKHWLEFLKDDGSDVEVSFQLIQLVAHLIRKAGHVRPVLHFIKEAYQTRRNENVLNYRLRSRAEQT